VDSECLGKAETGLATAFSKAETQAKSACATTGNAGALEATVDALRWCSRPSLHSGRWDQGRRKVRLEQAAGHREGRACGAALPVEGRDHRALDLAIDGNDGSQRGERPGDQQHEHAGREILLA